MSYIREDLANEIQDRYLYLLSRDPSEVSLRSNKLERKAIEKMAQIHSFRIENPDSELPFCVPKNNGRKHIKKGIAKLRRAYVWGTKNFDSENFDESFVREISGRIVPEIYSTKIAMYRDMGTQITQASTTPPYPRKIREKEIPNFERDMREKLKSQYPLDIMETAIYSHFHIARIHPFFDGNGRTARVVQDVILNHSSFPIPIIEVGERNTYYQILDKAVSDWKAQNNWENDVVTGGEELFYTFIAGKINASLDKLIQAL